MKKYLIFLVAFLTLLGCEKKSIRELNSDLFFITLKPQVGEFNDVKKIVRKGADVNYTEKSLTPLLNAAYGISKERGYYGSDTRPDSIIQKEKLENEIEAVKIVKFLVEKGANLNVKNRKGSNALHLAAFGGRPLMIQTLVDLGMNINEKNREGVTPLVLAAASGSLEAVKTCIKNGADINSKTNENYTALDVANQYSTEYSQKMGMSEYNQHKEIIEYLLENGAKKGNELKQ